MPVKRPTRKVPRKPQKVNDARVRGKRADQLAREVVRAWTLFERAAQSDATVAAVAELLDRTHAPTRVQAVMRAIAAAPRKPRGKLSWRAQLVQLLVHLAACNLFESAWCEPDAVTSAAAARELRRAANRLLELVGPPTLTLFTPEKARAEKLCAHAARCEGELLQQVRRLDWAIREPRAKLRKRVARLAGDLSIAFNIDDDCDKYGTTDAVMGIEAECYKRFREAIDYAYNKHGIDVLAHDSLAGDRTAEKPARKKARRASV